MVDILTLALTHGLMAYAAIRLMTRDELDEEGESKRVPRWKRQPPAPPAGEG